MKKYILVKVLIEDEDKGIEDKYEVDSQWSQETELFCEKIAYAVKPFVEDMNV